MSWRWSRLLGISLTTALAVSCSKGGSSTETEGKLPGHIADSTSRSDVDAGVGSLSAFKPAGRSFVTRTHKVAVISKKFSAQLRAELQAGKGQDVIIALARPEVEPQKLKLARTQKRAAVLRGTGNEVVLKRSYDSLGYALVHVKTVQGLDKLLGQSDVSRIVPNRTFFPSSTAVSAAYLGQAAAAILVDYNEEGTSSCTEDDGTCTKHCSAGTNLNAPCTTSAECGTGGVCPSPLKCNTVNAGTTCTVGGTQCNGPTPDCTASDFIDDLGSYNPGSGQTAVGIALLDGKANEAHAAVGTLADYVDALRQCTAGTGASTVGNACETNTDCGSGGVCSPTTDLCTAGLVSNIGKMCELNTECGTGGACPDWVCAAGVDSNIGNNCTSNGMCGTGGVCNVGTDLCTTGGSTVGEACTSNGECGTGGVCDLGATELCTAGTRTIGDDCTSNAECGTGGVCNVGTDTCTAGTGATNVGNACEQNSDCGVGGACRDTAAAETHATVMAGIVRTVAPAAQIHNVDITDGEGNATTVTILKALEHVHDDLDGDVSAVSLSFGDNGSYANAEECEEALGLEAAIDALLELDIVTFAAAGNGGSSTGMSLPGCLGNVVSVGAVQGKIASGVTLTRNLAGAITSCSQTSNLTDRVLCNSNSSGDLDLLAPGLTVDIDAQSNVCVGGVSAGKECPATNCTTNLTCTSGFCGSTTTACVASTDCQADGVCTVTDSECSSGSAANAGGSCTLDAHCGGTSGGCAATTAAQSGTSVAAAHAAASFAIMLAYNHDQGVDRAIARLKAGGTGVADPRNNVVTPRINLVGSLAQCVGPAFTENVTGDCVLHCVGGSDAGEICTSGSTCVSTVCGAGVCEGGLLEGDSCANDNACSATDEGETVTVSSAGSAVVVDVETDALCPQGGVLCAGGTSPGAACASDGECTGGNTCTGLQTSEDWLDAVVNAGEITITADANTDGTERSGVVEGFGTAIQVVQSGDTDPPSSATVAFTNNFFGTCLLGDAPGADCQKTTQNVDCNAPVVTDGTCGGPTQYVTSSTLSLTLTATGATKYCVINDDANTATGCDPDEYLPFTNSNVGDACTADNECGTNGACDEAPGTGLCTAGTTLASSLSPKTITWALSTGSGAKTVRAFFTDNLDNDIEAAAPVRVTRDTDAPTGTLVPTVSSGSVTFSLTGSADLGSGLTELWIVRSDSSPAPANCSAAVTAEKKAYTGGAAVAVALGTQPIVAGADYFYRVCNVDRVGNISTGTTFTAVAKDDALAPSGTIVAAATYNTSAASFAITSDDDRTTTGDSLGMAVPDVCISTTALTADTACPAPGWLTGSSPQSITLVAPDGPKTYYYKFRDNATPTVNVSTVKSLVVYLDSTNPGAGTITATTLTDNDMRLNWTGFSDVGGLQYIKVRFNGTATAPASCSADTALGICAGGTGTNNNGTTCLTSATCTGGGSPSCLTNLPASTTTITDITATASGDRSYRVCAVDKANNATGANKVTSLRSELTLPLVTAASALPVCSSTTQCFQKPVSGVLKKWTKDTTPVVRVSASDASLVGADVCINTTSTTTGCTWTDMAVTSGTTASNKDFTPPSTKALASGVGLRSYYIFVRDGVGNISLAKKVDVNMDPTGPTMGTTFSATKPASGQVKLSWTAANDGTAGSGLLTANPYIVRYLRGSTTAAPASTVTLNCTTGGTAVTFTSSPTTITTTKTALSNGYYYRFVLCAKDSLGTYSSPKYLNYKIAP